VDGRRGVEGGGGGGRPRRCRDADKVVIFRECPVSTLLSFPQRQTLKAACCKRIFYLGKKVGSSLTYPPPAHPLAAVRHKTAYRPASPLSFPPAPFVIPRAEFARVYKLICFYAGWRLAPAGMQRQFPETLHLIRARNAKTEIRS